MGMNKLFVVVILAIVSVAIGEILRGTTDCPRYISRGQMWFPSKCKKCECQRLTWECTDCKTLGFLWSKCYSVTIYGQVKCPGDIGYDSSKVLAIKQPSKPFVIKIKKAEKSKKPKISGKFGKTLFKSTFKKNRKY